MAESKAFIPEGFALVNIRPERHLIHDATQAVRSLPLHHRLQPSKVVPLIWRIMIDEGSDPVIDQKEPVAYLVYRTDMPAWRKPFTFYAEAVTFAKSIGLCHSKVVIAPLYLSSKGGDV